MKVHRGRPTSLRQALPMPCAQRFYGDGPPHWRVGRDNRPAPTAADAQNKQRNLVNLLKRTTVFEGAARELAERLDACSDLRPCLSGACLKCSRAVQRLIVHASEDIFGRPNKWAWTTSISHLDRVPRWRLAESLSLLWAEQRLLRAIEKYKIRTFGMLDIDVVEHQLHTFPACYQIHFHGLFAADRLKNRTQMLRACFPKTGGGVPKPVMIKGYDGRSRARGYMGRWPEKRRVSYVPKIVRDGKALRIREKPILSNQRVELALALDRAGLDARLVMFGYELRSDTKDVWLATVDKRRAKQLQWQREAAIQKRRKERLAKEYKQQKAAKEEENRPLNRRSLWRTKKKPLFEL